MNGATAGQGRYLVVCCDGTWNRADQRTAGAPTPTNVRLVHNALPNTERQLVQYFSGVGTDGGLLLRMFDGGVGRGLSRNIMNAYLWLAENYQRGDQLVLFGFSRGAYTVRSLVGMLTRCGLLDHAQTRPMAERLSEVKQVFNRGYRPEERDENWAAGLRFQERFGPDDSAPIAFLGVWDTVGALGVPRNFGLLGLLSPRKRYQFLDTKLHQDVQHARHAIAIDEQRAAFSPAVWNVPDEMKHRHKEVWFPGVHSDVGGGYPEAGLSHGALHWMVGEVQRCGVRLDWCTQPLSTLRANGADVLHDSFTGIHRWTTHPRPRVNPPIRAGREDVHRSAVQRASDPPITDLPYQPTKILSPGESETVRVFAHLPWSATGVYLTPGRYQLNATGEWIDKNIPAGPFGVPWYRHGAYLLASVSCGLQALIRKLSRNNEASFPLAKRVSGARWMELICVISDQLQDENGNTNYTTHRWSTLDDGGFVVERPGYLYAFANDTWRTYANNRGFLKLTIKRR